MGAAVDNPAAGLLAGIGGGAVGPGISHTADRQRFSADDGHDGG
ncbi:hypothetical protein [Streptomonospora arabica]|uniref:Uncharacterized protein n=1 Tax=Streptomonospora arabica TaxID=412417 RepID=A0ABV9SH73_9ACTN